MTRETKIGLLVGLGFIVVFAVLLSHNGSAPTQFAQQPLSDPSPGPAQDNTPSTVVPPLGSSGSHESLLSPAEDDWAAGGFAGGGVNGDLPAPREFEALGLMGAESNPPAPGNSDSNRTLEGTVTAALPRDPVVLEATPRVAPPVVDRPIPGARTGEPVASPLPEGTGESGFARGGGAEPTPPPDAAFANVVAPKPYTIKKGDTLIGIAQAMYNNASPKVITFVADANKGVIKDRHTLIEGQTIMVPPLPADMFETKVVSHEPAGRSLSEVGRKINDINVGGRRAPDVSRSDANQPPVARRNNSASSGRVELIPIGGTRQAEAAAPKAPDKIDAAESKDVKKDRATKPKKTSDKPAGRWYEVRSRDTFTSIAQRELGSSQRWTEIKSLNKDVDPAKIRPGMKLRLPGSSSSREPLSADASSRRAAA